MANIFSEQPPLLPAEPLTEHPNFTQIPNSLLDKHMAVLENGELRVLLYITRRTFGFGCRHKDIPIQQIATGLIIDGIRKDNGTGMDARSIQRSLKSLVERGLISRRMNFDTHSHPLASTYSLVVGKTDEIDPGISTTIKISQEEAQGDISTTSNPPIDPGISTTTYKKESPVEEEIKGTNNPLPPSEENQENAEFEEWTNDGGDLIIAALRPERGFNIGRSQRRLIKEKLAMVPIRNGLVERVVAAFANWAREHHRTGEPQLICQGRWRKCLMGEEEVSLDADTPPTPLPEIQEQAMLLSHPPSSQDLAEVQKQFHDKVFNGLPALALRWNEVVKSGPPVVVWKEHTVGDTALRALMVDPAFQSQSEALLVKAEKLCAAKHPKGSYLTFGWLIKPGKWCEVLNGQHDWLLGEGPPQAAKGVCQRAKEALRAEAAKKADKNA